MKTSPITAALLISFGAGIGAGAAPQIVDRVSSEELVARRQAGADALARLSTAREAALPTARPEHQDVIGNSEIISCGRFWTIVPKGAVLHIPEAMAARIKGEPTGDYSPWIDFLARNRAWLETVEVSIAEASGETALPANQTERWQKNGHVVVAVHRAGPISVIRGRSDNLELQEP